jgi:hypothetical protein
VHSWNGLQPSERISLRHTFTGIMFAQLTMATIGVTSITGEYSTGTPPPPSAPPVAVLVLLVPLLLVGSTSPGWLQAIYKALPLNAGDR